MSKTQFQKGDKAVYIGYGIVEVLDIERHSVSGQQVLFYLLKSVVSGIKVMIPTTTDKMRPVCDKTEAEAALNYLCDEPLNTSDIADTAELRSLNDVVTNASSLSDVAKAFFRIAGIIPEERGFGLRRLYQQALTHLSLEVAYSEGPDIDHESVRSEIEAIVEGRLA